MPIYDYKCEKCGQGFEHEHAMSYSGKVKCPSCGSTRTVKVFHAAGVHFKGSGFYVTDSSHSRSAITTPPATDNGSTNGAKNGAGESTVATTEQPPAKMDTAKSGSGKSKKPGAAVTKS